jgi:predicted nucleic acid-binding protein
VILVETSVLIQFLRGDHNEKVAFFEALISDGQPYGISTYTYAEVLQGARNSVEYQQLDEYLGSQVVYEPRPGKNTFKEAATIFYELRRKGYTIRGLIDVLIALTSLHNNLMLLHNDKDFEFIKNVEGRLKTI